MTTDSSPAPCSPLTLWLHPWRCAREMEELRVEAATLRDLLERTERDRERISTELTAAARREEEQRIESGRQIQSLLKERDDLRQEIGEWRQTRMELDAIGSQVKEWEALKARYEEKIEMLTLRLRDALGFRQRDSRHDDGSDILEEGESPFISEEEQEAREIRKKDGDLASRILADMFPDGEAGSISSPEIEAGRRRLPKDDSDWLISLPPV